MECGYVTKPQKKQSYKTGVSKRAWVAHQLAHERLNEKHRALKARVKILEDVLFARAELAKFRGEQ